MVEALNREDFMKVIKTPFSFAGGKTEVTKDTVTIINQKIESILNTPKFSRILHPLYGSNIAMLINEYPSEIILLDAKVEALMDLEENLSGATVLDMRFDVSSITSSDPILNVYLTYRLPIGTILGSTVKIAIPGIVTEDTIV
jgi:hypothetical protein